jgi:RNA polymerase sigma-70 factor, ECF subfamily
VRPVWYLLGSKNKAPRSGGRIETNFGGEVNYDIPGPPFQRLGIGAATGCDNPPRFPEALRLRPEASPLASDKELSDFLKSVEKRAFKRVAYAVRDDDAALDIVQDSMIRLSEKYVDRPLAELPLIFQRIVTNATMDWFRRQKVRHAVVRNFSDFEGSSEDDDFDLLETLEASGGSISTESAAESFSRAQILLLIDGEVSKLPTRQREAFLLRYWEELDVAETASVMGCSEGSVKTHCSRAVHALAKALRAKGIGT